MDQKNSKDFRDALNKKFNASGLEVYLQHNFSLHVLEFFGPIKSVNLIQKIKGPKQNTPGEIFFREKYAGNNFFYENNYLFVEIKITDIKHTIIDIFFDVFRNHPWSIKMKWNDSGDYCCRPVRNISLNLNDSLIPLEFAHQNAQKKSYKIPSFVKKIAKISEDLDKIPYELDKSIVLDHLIYCVEYSEILIIDFDIKYLEIPAQIISSFLLSEQLSVVLFKNNQLINKCLTLVENSASLDSKKFTKSVEAKLFDLFLQYKRDLARSVDDYLLARDTKIINNKIGTWYEKISRMYKISREIGLANPELSQAIKYYNLDISSEIVQEMPSLIGCITEQKIPIDNENQNLAKLLDYMDNLVQFAELDCLPTGNKDQFGLKKQCDFIIDFLLQRGFSFNFEKAEVFLQNRLKLQIEKINPLLNYLKIARQHLYKYKNFVLSLEKINRIVNLVAKSECDEHIELHEIEQRLVEKINHLNLENIEDLLERLSHYIEHTTIVPYLERKNLLEKFIDKAKEYLVL